MNRFENLTVAQIVDTIGTVDAQIKALEAEKKALREALEARGVDADTIVGTQFALTFALRETKTLDKKAVEAKLGADWIAANSKATTAVVMTIKAINAAAAAVPAARVA